MAPRPLPRTLTDLLKQPGHSPSEHADGLMVGMQVPLGEGPARGPPRNGTGKVPAWGGKTSSPGGILAAGRRWLWLSPRPPASAPTDKPPLNNAVAVASSLGRPRGHGKHLPLASGLGLPAPAYAAYAALQAGGECRRRGAGRAAGGKQRGVGRMSALVPWSSAPPPLPSQSVPGVLHGSAARPSQSELRVPHSGPTALPTQSELRVVPPRPTALPTQSASKIPQTLAAPPPSESPGSPTEPRHSLPNQYLRSHTDLQHSPANQSSGIPPGHAALPSQSVLSISQNPTAPPSQSVAKIPPLPSQSELRNPPWPHCTAQPISAQHLPKPHSAPQPIRGRGPPAPRPISTRGASRSPRPAG